MKVFLLAVLAVLATVHGKGVAPRLTRSGITYSLYTRENPSASQRLDITDARTITNSNFDSRRPTIVVTHGWRGNEQQSAVAVVRAAYITAGDYNVITIDWNSVQSIFSKPADTAREAGALIAEFLNFLQMAAGLNPATTTLIGHSLGAHAISNAARVAQGTYYAVIGLDPAGADFENDADAIAAGMQPGDATHVQVIHTNGGGMGLERATGTSDFYVNGGKSQPGCILDIVGICAHFRAPLFFAESLTSPTGFPTAEDSSVFLGGPVLSTHARGVYTLTTARNPPFALG